MDDAHVAARLSDRARSLRGGEESPFLTMMRLAAGYDRLINLGRGDPDLPTPSHIVGAAKAALDRGETKYTAPAGMPELRTAIADAIQHRWGVRYDSQTEVLITDGTQQGIFLSLQCLVNPGDEVLIPEPYYAAYEMGVAMAGGIMVCVPTRLEDQFELRPEPIRAAITPRTRVMALISPSNPTGGVILPETMAEIARIAEAHDLVVLSDELYESIVYDGIKIRSFPTFPGMRERTILLNGFSKAYCMTGLRVGYMAGPAAFLAGMVEPRHTISICTPAVSQHAALAALTGPQEFLTTYLACYDERRHCMADGLHGGGIQFGEPRGAFFIFADIRPTRMSSLDFCAQLLRQEQVLIFPGNLYGPGGEGFVRISYLAPLDQIREATTRIVRFYTNRLS